MANELVLKRIEEMEQELRGLKKKVSGKVKPARLKGLLKGVKFNEKDFEEAKKSWFKRSHA
ncbi:MAG TPA: hypothetical protein VJA40_02050 [archaeon]|nr:hypothetical protein [archaeon]